MRLHRTLDQIDVPSPPFPRVSPDFRTAFGSGVLAVAGLVAAGGFGDIHSRAQHDRIIGAAGATAFLAFGSVAVRSIGNQLYRTLRPRTGNAHAAVIRALITLTGSVIVVLSTLDLLAVPVRQLLLGGALTGVFVGIAGQQALSNVFAGLVLLLARPFTIGEDIRLRSGALGGELAGQVLGIGLTYVTLQTADGPLSVPNSGMLAAAIGPAAAAAPDPPQPASGSDLTPPGRASTGAPPP